MKVDANTLCQWRMEKARNIFGLFAKYVNPRLEFAPFHIVYYRILHRFATGKIKKLIISMPPQARQKRGFDPPTSGQDIGPKPGCPYCRGFLQ